MQDRAVAFCDWLTGFFQITAAGSGEEEIKLKPAQVKLVRDKLNEVYPRSCGGEAKSTEA